MSDDWSTMNLNRDKVSREFEVLRRRYMDHRDTVARLAADAPTEHLARQYNAIRSEIETAIAKLHELEVGGGAPPQVDSPRPRTAPGVAPAPLPPPPATSPAEWQPANAPVTSSAAGSRILAIAAIGIIVLALLGFLAFRAYKKKTPKVVEQPTATATTTTAETTTVVPLTPASSVAVKPASQDYGTVKKGTRTMRKFDLTNETDKPITVQLSRSNCRCLWFDYPSTIPAKGSVTAMVTVDGAKAKKGPLAETIQVTAKNDPTVNTSFEIKASVE